MLHVLTLLLQLHLFENEMLIHSLKTHMEMTRYQAGLLT